jgi:hypothetical protein
MLRLPLEIYMLALHYLADDAKTLKRCSLVHRAWTDDAQKLLFGHHFVRIGVQADARSFDLSARGGAEHAPIEFHKAVKKNPTFASRIQCIALNFSDMERIATNSNGLDWAFLFDSLDPEWVEDPTWNVQSLFEPLISSRLPCLQKIRIFDIRDIRPLTPCFPCMTSTSESLIAQLGSIISLEFSSTLQFAVMSDLQYFLYSLPNLQHLTLSRISLLSQRRALVSPPKNISLRSLKLNFPEGHITAYSSWDPILDWLATTDTVQSLQYLAIVDWDSVYSINQLLSSLTGQVCWEIHDSYICMWAVASRCAMTNLTLTIGNDDHLRFTCHGLAELIIHVKLHEILDKEDRPSPEDFVFMLEKVDAPSLRRVIFRLDPGAKYVRFQEWQDLWMSPLSGDHFPTLELLSFEYDKGIERLYDCGSFRRAFQDYDARGVICFTQTAFEEPLER